MIGFLTPVEPRCIERLGNAALRGARELLLSAQKKSELEALVGRIKHVELEAEPDFVELFADACRFERLPI